VQDIGIGVGRPPEVHRSEGSTTLYLTLRGIREARVRDRETRLRIALPVVQATRLWRLLDHELTDEEKAVAVE
jgi:hypothetical protein